MRTIVALALIALAVVVGEKFRLYVLAAGLSLSAVVLLWDPSDRR
jgi:hypothetical protein